MADIKISELTQVSELNNEDLIEVSQVNALAPSGYTSLKASMTNLGNKVNKDIEYTTDLADFTDKTTLGAIKETAKDKNVADEYDDTQTYDKGDVVIYKNTLYICTTNNTTGTWDSTKWTATTVQSLIGSLSQLTTKDKSSLVGAVKEVVSDKADKSALTWTLLGETTGTAEQNLPATWNEIQVYGMFGGNAQYGFVAHTIYAHIGSNPSRYIQGGADKEGGTDHHIAIWHIESGKIGLNFWRYNNTDYTSTAKLIVYYR